MPDVRRVLVLRPAKEREASMRSLLRTGAEIVTADHPGNDLVGLGDIHLPLPDVPSAFQAGNISDIEARLQTHHDEHPFTAVVVHYDYLLPLVGRLNERWGLRGHDERSGLLCSNKRLQRAALEAAAVPQPRWHPCADLDAARGAAERLGWPVVVKPADRAASCAVSIVRTAEELDEAVNAALAESWGSDILVEELAEGPEFSVESIVQAGEVVTLVITAKGIGGRTGVLETTAEMPAPVAEADRAAIAAAAAAAVRACGLKDGPAHTEVRLTEAGARIIEVNGRVGGLFLSDMVQAVTGIDLYQAWFQILHGLPADLEPRVHGVAMFQTLTDLEGLVESVDVAALSPTVRSRLLVLRSFVQRGQQLDPIDNGNEIRGVVAAFAHDRHQAREALDEIAAALTVRLQASTSPARQEVSTVVL